MSRVQEANIRYQTKKRKSSERLNIQITENAIELFRDACIHGKITKARHHFLYIPVKDRDVSDEILNCVCLNNHLNFAKWLITVKTNISKWIDTIDHYGHMIAINRFHICQKMSNSLFFCTFEQRNFEMAKWLFQMKPSINITQEDHRLFGLACEISLKHAEWIMSLRPFLYRIRVVRVVPSDSKGEEKEEVHSYRIRAFEERQWQGRKYALWMRGVKGVFYEIPEDVSRYIVQTFL